MSSEPVALGDAMAAFLARYPMTPERAASNARILDEEVAAYDEAHPELAGEEMAEFSPPAA